MHSLLAAIMMVISTGSIPINPVMSAKAAVRETASTPTPAAKRLQAEITNALPATSNEAVPSRTRLRLRR